MMIYDKEKQQILSFEEQELEKMTERIHRSSEYSFFCQLLDR